MKPIERSFNVLRHLASAPSSFSELKTLLDIGDAPLSRLLKALFDLGLITGGGGNHYQLTPKAIAFGNVVAGRDNFMDLLRQELAECSQVVHAGVAAFKPVPEKMGLLCLAKHDVPEAVSFVGEGKIRQPLMGHGSAVMACAFDDSLNQQWGAQLREDLSWTLVHWTTKLQHIQDLGYYLAHGEEYSIKPNVRLLDTLARISVPIWNKAQLRCILCSTAHARSADIAFPPSAIEFMVKVGTTLSETLNSTEG